MGVSEARARGATGFESAIDWKRVLQVSLASRALDEVEETRLVPEQKVLYQFSARGHEMAQVILGSLLDRPHDAVGA
jgi:2-oxoisovalerate dehydrogenase E1 component